MRTITAGQGNLLGAMCPRVDVVSWESYFGSRCTRLVGVERVRSVAPGGLYLMGKKRYDYKLPEHEVEYGI